MEGEKFLLKNFNQIEEDPLDYNVEEFVASHKKCIELKRAISLVANSDAVDCLLKEFEQNFMNRCFYENQLCKNGMDELLMKYNKEYFEV
jgi:hypothetical protein